MFARFVAVCLCMPVFTFGYGVRPAWEHDPLDPADALEMKESDTVNDRAATYGTWLEDLKPQATGDKRNDAAFLSRNIVEDRQVETQGDYEDRITALKEELTGKYDNQIKSMMQQIDVLVRQSGKIFKLLGKKDAGAAISKHITAEEEENQSLLTTGGVQYIRWGRNTCPNTTVELYKGYAAGTYHATTYGGVNTLCVHDDPQWGTYNDAAGPTNYIVGAEYRVADMPFSTKNNGGLSLLAQDMPCVACHSNLRSTQIMIPARRECPMGWTVEYRGYIVCSMGTYSRSDFICIDEEPDVKLGGHKEELSLLFYPIKAYCGSLTCPKYVHNRQIACVVCSK